MKETINRSVMKLAVGSQVTKNSRGFNVGSRIQVKADAFLPKKLSYARCCVGVVTHIGKFITVQLEATNNFETHCILVKPEWLELLKPVDCSTASADLRKLPELQEASPSPSRSNSTQTPRPYCDITAQTSPSIATSETIIPGTGSLIYSRSDSPAQEPAMRGSELDYSIQNQPSGLKPCAVSVKESRASWLLKTLKDWSITDFEQCLEDSEFADIVGTIHKSFRLRNSERRTKGKDFLSLPTPTTYAKGSTGCRPAGATRLEQRLRKFIAKGDKLHPAAPGWMMGFHPGYVESALMDGGINIQLPFIPEFVTTPPSDEKPVTCTPDPSVPNKLRSPSVESCTCPSCAEPLLRLEDGCGVCGWLPSKRKRSPNKKPATGSLARNVALKKGKEYSTWQYSYSVRTPETKKGWRTVKEGVPKHLSPVVADAIREGKPIREILGLLGKELQGDISE